MRFRDGEPVGPQTKQTTDDICRPTPKRRNYFDERELERKLDRDEELSMEEERFLCRE